MQSGLTHFDFELMAMGEFPQLTDMTIQSREPDRGYTQRKQRSDKPIEGGRTNDPVLLPAPGGDSNSWLNKCGFTELSEFSRKFHLFEDGNIGEAADLVEVALTYKNPSVAVKKL